jgi:hypothetical protein
MTIVLLFSAKTRNFTDCLSGKPPQAIAHIRCLFSVLAGGAPLSLFGASPDSIIFIAFRVRSRDPAIRRSRKARPCSRELLARGEA